MNIKFTSDTSVLKKALVVLAGLFIICIVGLLIYIVKYSKYVEVTAKIVDVRLVYDNQDHDNQSRNKYIQYKYSFGGKEYCADRLVFWGSKRSIGREVIIRINPQNPSEIANYTYIKSLVFIGILPAAVFILIMKDLRN